jgi:hypothetical protein
MRNKTLSFYFLIILALLASACGGTTPTITTDEVQTIAAVTFQAMTSQPVDSPIPPASTSEAAPALTEPPISQVPSVPTPTSMSIPPRGSFIPYPATDCEALRAAFESTLGSPVILESVPFRDSVSGGTGYACRVHASGNGNTLNGSGGPLDALLEKLETLGWVRDDFNYSAAGPTGMATGLRRGGALGLLTYGWDASPDANCPDDQPISMCNLAPEQRLWDITFDAADRVVYNPPAETECASAKDALQPSFPIPLSMELVEFIDFEQNRGFGCQVRAEGNGITFTGIIQTVDAIDAVLTPLGWALFNGADGPIGTGREYALREMAAVVFVKWTPSPDANCPKDQPIGACQLTPAQMLYTVTITFGEK